MAQALLAILLTTLAICLSGCESFVYTYDCRGRLLTADGRPASCVPVHVDTDGPPHSADWDGDVLETAVTDANGRFRAFCVGQLYTSWFGITRDAPRLREVFLWFKRHGRWSAIPVRLTDAEQLYRTHEGRQINLPAISLPKQNAMHQ